MFMKGNKDKTTVIHRFLNGTYTVDEAYAFLEESNDPVNKDIIEEAAFSVWEESQFLEKNRGDPLNKEYKEEAYTILKDIEKKKKKIPKAFVFSGRKHCSRNSGHLFLFRLL